jgi:hypothetical protein
MFRIFKNKEKSLKLNNNQIIFINEKRYLVGYALLGNDIILHCLDK